MTFKYKLSSTGGSSNKYGVCEICKKHTAEVYQQSKFKGNAHVGNTFGHEQCLSGVRK